MNRLFLLLLPLILFGSNSFWNYTYSYETKKDEVVKISIKKDYLPTKKSDGILKFRWTLYSGKRLVLLVDYEGFKYHYLLEKNYKRNIVTINLIGDFPSIKERAFALIKFRDFKNNRAFFDVKIRDPQKRLEVRFK